MDHYSLYQPDKIAKRGFLLPQELAQAVDRVDKDNSYLYPVVFILSNGWEYVEDGLLLGETDEKAYFDSESVGFPIYIVLLEDLDILKPNSSAGLIFTAYTQGNDIPEITMADENEVIAKHYNEYMLARNAKP